jgi:hypothetical protein
VQHRVRVLCGAEDTKYTRTRIESDDNRAVEQRFKRIFPAEEQKQLFREMMASCSFSKAPEVCAQESPFDLLPDDLIIHVVLKALETSIKDATDWPQTCVGENQLLRFRLVCKRLAGLVPQLPCTILWSLGGPSGPNTETLVQKFLEQSEGATRGLGLSLARFESSILRVRNDISPDFFLGVLKLTPNLELLFMKGPFFGWGDGSAATEQFFSSISCCRKFSNLHLQLDAIDLTRRLGQRFDSLRRIHLWAQDQKSKSGWILSDEGLADLIESCPRLEALSIQAYQVVEGLKSPVLRSSSLAVLHLINLFIEEKLTVDAPLLSNLFLPIVSDASVRTGRAPVALVFPNGDCKSLQLSNPSAVSNIIFTGRAWTHERLFRLLRQCWNAANLEFRGSFKVEGEDLDLLELLYCHRCALEEIRFEGGSLASFDLAASEKSFRDGKWNSKLRLAVVLICNVEHDLLLCSALVKAAPHLQHLELKIRGNVELRESVRRFSIGIARSRPQLNMSATFQPAVDG